MNSSVKWASAISELVRTEAAVQEAGEAIRRELGMVEPDLVVAFVSPDHAASFRWLPELVAAQMPNALLIGCSGSGVIGAGHEVEERPALSLTAASLPGVDIAPWYVDGNALIEDASVLRGLVGAGADADPHFIILADPLSCDAGALIAGLDAAYAAGRKIGGLASGGARPGSNALFLGSAVFSEGAVGVALSGNIDVDTIVAQGCRPIGVPMPITHCERNVLLEVGGRKPLEVLRELYETLDERDRGLCQQSLFVGLEMREDAVEYRDADLLVRNIIGMDPRTGSMSIGASPGQWQVVRFLLRDADAATGDLSRLLDQYATSASATGPRPSGALLFSCLGRGIHLFGAPDHDTELFRQRLGHIPLGGFFCNGEIGPVGGATFLHGYTSSFGLFREKAS